MSVGANFGAVPSVIEGRQFTAHAPPPLTAGAVFSNCSFEGLSWQGTTFEGMRFSNCRLTSVEFADCDTRGLAWDRCALEGVRWQGGSLRESQWHDSTLSHCGWRQCAIEGLHLSSVSSRGSRFAALEARHLAIVASDFAEVRFDSCVLTDTSWIRGRVTELALEDCECRNVIFGQLESTRVRLHRSRGQNLRWVQCEGRGTEVMDCDFKQAAWSHGQLIDSKLHQTKLLTAGFEHCRLQHVEFSNSTLASTQFDAAELVSSRFERVLAPGLSLRLARLQQVAFQHIDLQQLDARGATLADVTFERADCRHSRLDGQDKSLWLGADTAGSQYTDPRTPMEQAWWQSKRPGIRDT